MVLFASDENFNNEIVRGILLRNPAVDIVRIQDAGLAGSEDERVLEWAAQSHRILLTHDVATITHYAYARVRAALPMPGVIEVHLGLPCGKAIDDILLIAECSVEGEWKNQVWYLPLR